MALHDLGSVACVTLKDFNDILSISFGINLALPLFRELVVVNRRAITKRIPAIQSIVEGRTYSITAEKQEHLAVLSRARIDLLRCDRDLTEKINLCSVVAFLFSVYSIGWLFAGVYNPQCLSGAMVFISIWINFLPLPISVGFLWWKSRTAFAEINSDLDGLMEKLM